MKQLVVACAVLALLGCSGGTGRRAIVWNSQVDDERITTTEPAPSRSVGVVEISLDVLAFVDGDQPLCRDAVQFAPAPPESLDDCLLVQYRVTVGIDAAEPATIRAASLRGEDGQLTDPMAAETLIAYGGSDQVAASALFANAAPGSTVMIEAGGLINAAFEFDVPLDGFEDITWDVGAVADDRL